MKSLFLKLWNDEEGAEIAEWVVVVALLVIVAILIYNGILQGPIVDPCHQHRRPRSRTSTLKRQDLPKAQGSADANSAVFLEHLALFASHAVVHRFELPVLLRVIY